MKASGTKERKRHWKRLPKCMLLQGVEWSPKHPTWMLRWHHVDPMLLAEKDCGFSKHDPPSELVLVKESDDFLLAPSLTSWRGEGLWTMAEACDND
ncbi:hypothetical protein VNO80_25625 [Phaseolus coccineus]|uniref:Uncharacterized protein n=1 Tax=Phaseolus coccineus TaxID=3886 RepID=A0AAN9LY68_PHACN